jgi:hypothetical protein
MPSFLIFSQLADALHTHVLALIKDQALCRTTENAGCFALTQNDPVLLQIHFHFVPLCDIQRTAQTDRKYDSAKLIHLTDDTRGFHMMINSFRL